MGGRDPQLELIQTRAAEARAAGVWDLSFWLGLLVGLWAVAA